MKKDKIRDMIRSILPSKSRKYARWHKTLRKRNVRREVRLDVRVEVPEETAVDFGRDAYVRDIVRMRRGADKLRHFLRWCEAITKGMPDRDADARVRAILPRNVIGDHAWSHWEWQRKPPPAFELPSMLTFQSWFDSTRVRLARELARDPSLHARLNAAIKRRKQPDQPRRMLHGVHDIDDFVRDIWGDPFAVERIVTEGACEGALRISGAERGHEQQHHAGRGDRAAERGQAVVEAHRAEDQQRHGDAGQHPAGPHARLLGDLPVAVGAEIAPFRQRAVAAAAVRLGQRCLRCATSQATRSVSR